MGCICESAKKKLNYALKTKNKDLVFTSTKDIILQQLDHPNIIKFHEVYQNRINFYICMDYCKGGEQVEWIPKKYKTFHKRNIQEIMKKIMYAVACIHNEGIVHRDIKAENIMIANKKDNAEPKFWFIQQI